MKKLLKNIINKIKNCHLSKKTCFILFFIPISVSIYKNMSLDNDIWFILNHGRYILNNGFPTIEPFTIHEGFNFIIQQWLTAIIYYSTYKYFGPIGLVVLIQIINILIIYFLYKLCMMLSENRFRLSILITIVIDTLLSIFFIVSRPQIFTYLVITLELYCIESYIKKGNNKYIFVLPILSLLEINLHCSMWFMLFILMLPYYVEYIFNKINKNKIYHIKPIIIATISMLIVGFLNPYGYKAITYLFASYGNSTVNSKVSEMLPLNLNEGWNIVVYIIIQLVAFIYIITRRQKIKIRYILLYFGTITLTFMQRKSASYFFIAGIFPLAYYLKDYFKIYPEDNKTIKANFQWISSMIIIIITVLYCLIQEDLIKDIDTNKIEKGVNYLLENYKKDNIILYVDYYNGGYTEYMGIKSYMDPRAEVFLKSLNNKEDIFKEYILLQERVLDCQDFLNKYNFTHLLISEEDTLWTVDIEKYNYTLIYEEETYKIYKRKDIHTNNYY